MSTKEVRKFFKKVHGPFSFATFTLGIRTTLGLSQVDMAKKLCISKAALCEVEKSRTLVGSAGTPKRQASLSSSPLKRAFKTNFEKPT